MSMSTPVADWNEVRDQELSEIVTRRLAAGLLPPEALADLERRWAQEGLLPAEVLGETALRLTETGQLAAESLGELVKRWQQPGATAPAGSWSPDLLAEIVERRAVGLVDPGLGATGPNPEPPLLAPAPVAELVKRWARAGLLPPEARHLTAANLGGIVQGSYLKELAGLLRPLDVAGEIDLLPDEDIQALAEHWQKAGLLEELARTGAASPPASGTLSKSYLQQVYATGEPQARYDLDEAFRKRRVRAFLDFFKSWRQTGLLPRQLLDELAVRRRQAGLVRATEGRLEGGWLQPAEILTLVQDLSPEQRRAYEERRQSAGPLSPESNQVLVFHALVLEALMREEVSRELVGLALSGGGIRSASFNLGLLQALQQGGLLRYADYLATVSGGGYVGSLVSSLTLRADIHFDRKKYPDKKAPLEPAPNGKQPERVVQLIRSGSYLNRPWLFASRYLVGLVLNNLVLLSGLVAMCAGLAWLWRVLDTVPLAENLTLWSNGWIGDANRSFLPAAVLAVAWPFGWAFSFRRRRPGPPRWLTTVGVGLLPLGLAIVSFWGLWTMELPGNPYPVWLDQFGSWPWQVLILPVFLLAAAVLIAWVLDSVESHRRLAPGWTVTILLILALVAAAIGLMVWLSNPTINWANRLELQDRVGGNGVETWHRGLLLPLLVLLVAGLVPAFWMRRLVTPEAQGHGYWQPLLLRVASWTMLVGIPLFLIFILASQNVTGAAGMNRNSRVTATDFRDWNAFWDKVCFEHRRWRETGPASPHTPGSWIWEKLDRGDQAIVKRINRSLQGAECCADEQSLNHQERGEILRGRAQNFEVPPTAEDRDGRTTVAQALNTQILEDMDFYRRTPVFTAKGFLETLGKNHKQWHYLEMGLFKARQDKAARDSLLVAPLAFHAPDMLGHPGGLGRLALAGAYLTNKKDHPPDRMDVGFQARMYLNRLLLEAYFPYDLWERSAVHRTLLLPPQPNDEEHPSSEFLMDRDQRWRGVVCLASAAVFVAFGWVVSLNRTSLHRIYRKQLARMYNEPLPGYPDGIPLRLLDTTIKGGPYHLLGAALNKGSSQGPFAHPTANFLFSRRYCGAEFTGYARTEDYIGGDLDLGSAMAISGAAFSPARVANPFVAFLMVILNLRLGQWLSSPRHPQKARWLPIFRLGVSLLRHRIPEDRRYWFVSDGGHDENLGLGMLLRRECRLIVVSDAGQDPDYGFEDFARIYRRARLRGIQFKTLDQSGFISLDPLVPDKATGTSPHRYILARITYPGPDKKEGLLIYLKPSFTGDEEVDLKHYRAANHTFPHDPTTNQWFNEDQVESYRELGFWIGKHLGDACVRGLGSMTPAGAETLQCRWHDRLQQPLNDLIAAWQKNVGKTAPATGGAASAVFANSAVAGQGQGNGATEKEHVAQNKD